MSADAMNELRDQVGPGWTVKIIDHDYLNDSRDNVDVSRVITNGLILRPKRPWSSQGRSYSTMNFTWDGDMEVNGTSVTIYRTPAPHTGKPRVSVKTFVFRPPVV